MFVNQKLVSKFNRIRMILLALFPGKNEFYNLTFTGTTNQIFLLLITHKLKYRKGKLMMNSRLAPNLSPQFQI
jgi:hypothetical protein